MTFLQWKRVVDDLWVGCMCMNDVGKLDICFGNVEESRGEIRDGKNKDLAKCDLSLNSTTG